MSTHSDKHTIPRMGDAKKKNTTRSDGDKNTNKLYESQKKLVSFIAENKQYLGKAPLIMYNDALKVGNIEFLNQWDWQWYFTLTFVSDIHPEQANKLFRRWISKLNVKHYGKYHYKRNQFIDWVRSSEYQKRGVIHFHGLLNASDTFNQFEAMKSWENLDGIFKEEGKTGMARIYEAIQPAVEIYITKYVTKELNIELSPDLKADFTEIHRQEKISGTKYAPADLK